MPLFSCVPAFRGLMPWGQFTPIGKPPKLPSDGCPRDWVEQEGSRCESGTGPLL